MADFNELTTAETAYKAGVGQDLLRKIKDNFTNIHSRLTVEEGQIRLFDHFNRLAALSDLSFGGALQSGSTELWTRDWLLYADSSSSLNNFIAAKPSWSVARLAAISGVSTWAVLQSLLIHQFNESTRPLVLEARFKRSADSGGWRLGMRKPLQSDPVTTDAEGIWLERVDSTNWRFVSYDTARNNGVNFAKPTTGAWVKVRIEFDSTPGNEARCYIDNVLKDTLTTQLPTSKRLAAMLATANGISGNTDFDFADWKSAGIAETA